MKKRFRIVSFVIFFVFPFISSDSQEKPDRGLIEVIHNSIGIETKWVNAKTGTSIGEVYIGLPAVDEFSFASNPDILGKMGLKKIVYPIKKYGEKITRVEFKEKSIAETVKNPTCLYFKILSSGEVFIIYKEESDKMSGWSVNREGKTIDHVRKIHDVIEDSYGNPFWIIDDNTRRERGVKFYLLKTQGEKYSLRNLYFSKEKELKPVIFAPKNKELAYLETIKDDFPIGVKPSSSYIVTIYMKKVLRKDYIGRISAAGEELTGYTLAAGEYLKIMAYTYSTDAGWIAAISRHMIKKIDTKTTYGLSINGKFQYISDKELSNLGVVQTRLGKNWVCLLDGKQVLVNGISMLEKIPLEIISTVMGNNKIDYFDDETNPFFLVIHQKEEGLTYSIFSARHKLADVCFVPQKQSEQLKKQRIDIEKNFVEDVFFDVSKNFIGVIRNTSISNVSHDFSGGGKPGSGKKFKKHHLLNIPDIFCKLRHVTYCADLFLTQKRRNKRILVSIPSYTKPHIFWSGNGRHYGVLFSFADPGVKNHEMKKLKKIREVIVRRKPSVYQVIINGKLLPFDSSEENPKIVFSEDGHHFAFIGKTSSCQEFIVTDRYRSQDFYKVLDIRMIGDKIIGLGVKKTVGDGKIVYRIVKIHKKL